MATISYENVEVKVENDNRWKLFHMRSNCPEVGYCALPLNLGGGDGFAFWGG